MKIIIDEQDKKKKKKEMIGLLLLYGIRPRNIQFKQLYMEPELCDPDAIFS